MLFQKRRRSFWMPELYPSPDGSELCLCMPKMISTYKDARSARRYAPKSRHMNMLYNMMKTQKPTGRPTATAPRIHRYNFKLTTAENIRFKEMLATAGLEHNYSRFIVKRLFAECIEFIKCSFFKISSPFSFHEETMHYYELLHSTIILAKGLKNL